MLQKYIAKINGSWIDVDGEVNDSGTLLSWTDPRDGVVGIAAEFMPHYFRTFSVAERKAKGKARYRGWL